MTRKGIKMTNDEAKSVLFDMLGKGIYVKDTKENQAILVALRALEQEPCDDAISRKAVMQLLYDYGCESEIQDAISKLPPIRSQPKTGHWIERAQYSDGKHKIECSECKSHIFDRGHANSFNVKNKYKYCPNCGIKMIEPQESEVEE